MSRETPGDGQAMPVFFEPEKSKYTQPVKTVTEQIADVLTSEFLSHLDYQIDLHDGPITIPFTWLSSPRIRFPPAWPGLQHADPAL